MNIISGIYKGQIIKSPNNFKTHPMGNREKLALFNMLNPYLADATVLDAYAGSGALGLEALSRGAKQVFFLEKDPKIAQIIRTNALKITQTNKNYEIIVKNVKSFAPSIQFDLILLDPPYDHFDPAEFIHLENSLAPTGILALSSPKDTPLPDFKSLKLVSTHTYAAARISLFTH